MDLTQTNKDPEKCVSDRHLFLEVAIVFSESKTKWSDSKTWSLPLNIILGTLPKIHKEKEFSRWKEYWEKGISLGIFISTVDFMVKIKKTKCMEIIEKADDIESLRAKISKNLKKVVTNYQTLKLRRDHENISKSPIDDSKADPIKSSADANNAFIHYRLIAEFIIINNLNDWVDCDKFLLVFPKYFYKEYGYSKFREYLENGESLQILELKLLPKPFIKMTKKMTKKVMGQSAVSDKNIKIFTSKLPIKPTETAQKSLNANVKLEDASQDKAFLGITITKAPSSKMVDLEPLTPQREETLFLKNDEVMVPNIQVAMKKCGSTSISLGKSSSAIPMKNAQTSPNDYESCSSTKEGFTWFKEFWRFCR